MKNSVLWRSIAPPVGGNQLSQILPESGGADSTFLSGQPTFAGPVPQDFSAATRIAEADSSSDQASPSESPDRWLSRLAELKFVEPISLESVLPVSHLDSWPESADQIPLASVEAHSNFLPAEVNFAGLQPQVWVAVRIAEPDSSSDQASPNESPNRWLSRLPELIFVEPVLPVQHLDSWPESADQIPLASGRAHSNFLSALNFAGLEPQAWVPVRIAEPPDSPWDQASPSESPNRWLSRLPELIFVEPVLPVQHLDSWPESADQIPLASVGAHSKFLPAEMNFAGPEPQAWVPVRIAEPDWASNQVRPSESPDRWLPRLAELFFVEPISRESVFPELIFPELISLVLIFLVGQVNPRSAATEGP